MVTYFIQRTNHDDEHILICCYEVRGKVRIRKTEYPVEAGVYYNTD